MPERPSTDAFEPFCGFYGSLPSQGGVVVRGLPDDVAGRLRAWLDGGIAHVAGGDGRARERLLAQAPAWRFAAAQGLFAGEAVTGVMAVSRDKDGTLYPCIAAASLGQSDAASAAACGRWSEGVEMLVRTAVTQSLDADHLAEALMEIGRPQPAIEPRPFEVTTIRGGVRVDVEATPTLAVNMVQAARAAHPAIKDLSFWWRVGGLHPGLLWLEGLPRGEAFESLFAAPAGRIAGLSMASPAP